MLNCAVLLTRLGDGSRWRCLLYDGLQSCQEVAVVLREVAQ
jgi:hypothetical protein